MIKVNGVVKRETREKKPYRQVHLILQNNEEVALNCFEDIRYADTSTFFGLLDMATLPEICKGKAVPARFKVIRVGQHINIRRPELIANVSFDSDGVPVTDRSAR